MNEPSPKNNQSGVDIHILSIIISAIIIFDIMNLFTPTGAKTNATSGLFKTLLQLQPWILRIGIVMAIGACAYFTQITKNKLIQVILVLLILFLIGIIPFIHNYDPPRLVPAGTTTIISRSF